MICIYDSIPKDDQNYNKGFLFKFAFKTKKLKDCKIIGAFHTHCTEFVFASCIYCIYIY